jgi:glycine hydroxymethyltransferase
MVYLHENLKEIDPELNELVEQEQDKQIKSIQLIASENYPSKAVSETLSSCLSVLYIDKYPKLRFL